MELDLVDAVAEAIVRAQPRRVLVGLRGPLPRLGRVGRLGCLSHVMKPRIAEVVLRFIAVSGSAAVLSVLYGLPAPVRTGIIIGAACSGFMELRRTILTVVGK